MNIDEHVAWLLKAISVGAKRHDSFEVERHVDLSGAQAIELGALLHGVAGSQSALVAVESAVIRYRRIDGSDGQIIVNRSADGRLEMPTFS